MTSIRSPPLPPPPSCARAEPNAGRFPSRTPIRLSNLPRRSLPRLKKSSVGTSRSPPVPFLCRCRKNPPSGEQEEGNSPNDGSGPRSWDSLVHDVVSGAAKKWDGFFSAFRNSWSRNGPSANAVTVGEENKKMMKDEEVEDDGGYWDWERWKRHFKEIEDQERILSALKSQLNDAISREDYEDAAKLKLAIAGATGNDIVGTAISTMNRAIEEERYDNAAYIRDHAGAGLVGWWAGISEDGVNPFGQVIRISAEYGRYVARSYSPRQLATGRPGLPLFEIYFTRTNKGYKQQVAYLKQNDNIGDLIKKSEKKPGFSNLHSYDSSKGEDEEEDLLSMEEEAGSYEELESIELDDFSTDLDIDGIEMDAGDSTNTRGGKGEISLQFVISGQTPKLFADLPLRNLVRVPARLEKRDHLSFSIILDKDVIKCGIDGKKQTSKKKAFACQSELAKVMTDKEKMYLKASRYLFLQQRELAKAITDKEKMYLKVLKYIEELINDSVYHFLFEAIRKYIEELINDSIYHSLFDATLFSRIEMPLTSDPLTGLYIDSHGMYSSKSNVLHLKRKFGQWQEDLTSQKKMDLEFYEYVEAIKLTGDLSVPAGQVAFRAKVGKQNQLPHKGVIPEEFGVIARYKGQGRLDDPGYRNPQWVDGELVIFDGKYSRGGPAIGFVCWELESHSMLLLKRLMLPA